MATIIIIIIIIVIVLFLSPFLLFFLSLWLISIENEKILSRYGKHRNDAFKKIVPCQPNKKVLEVATNINTLGIKLPKYSVEYSEGWLFNGNMDEVIAVNIEAIKLKLRHSLSQEQIAELDRRVLSESNCSKEKDCYCIELSQIDVNHLPKRIHITINVTLNTVVILSGYDAVRQYIVWFYNNERDRYESADSLSFETIMTIWEKQHPSRKTSNLADADSQKFLDSIKGKDVKIEDIFGGIFENGELNYEKEVKE